MIWTLQRRKFEPIGKKALAHRLLQHTVQPIWSGRPSSMTMIQSSCLGTSRPGLNFNVIILDPRSHQHAPGLRSRWPSPRGSCRDKQHVEFPTMSPGQYDSIVRCSQSLYEQKAPRELAALPLFPKHNTYGSAPTSPIPLTHLIEHCNAFLSP